MQQCPHAEAQSAPGSWSYLLEPFDVGRVHLDGRLRMIDMNELARRSQDPDDSLAWRVWSRGNSSLPQQHGGVARPARATCRLAPN